MAVIELFVRNKAVDLVAATARGTLCRNMGHARDLVGLGREDYWRIDVSCKADEAVSLARELAHATKLFVNPNKHTCRIRVDGSFLEGADEGAAEPGVHTVHALVGYRDDEKAILTADTLRRTLGYGEVIRSVTRGTWWTLRLTAASADAARALAEGIIVTRGVDRGLLMNPHSQEYTLF